MAMPLLTNRAVHPLRPLLLIALLAVGLVGCRGSRDAARPLGVVLAGEPDLNGGNAAVVRLYALAGDANFTRVPPGTFWQDDQAALGDELIGAPREIVLFPQTTEEVTFALDTAAEFVGVAANLAAPDADRWRAIVPAETLRRKALRVTVGRTALTLDVRDR